MICRLSFLALVWAVGAALCAEVEHNRLKPEETAAGWRLLFDGKSFANWRDPNGMKPASDSWTIRDGCLVAVRDPRLLDDLETEDTFNDFELSFEWRVDPGGNSGIKYHIWENVFLLHTEPGYLSGKVSQRAALQPDQRGQTYNIGYEFQLIDDARHPDAARGTNRRTGALYGILPPSEPAGAEAGQWHRGLLVVKKGDVQHWVNGRQVLTANLGSAEIREAVRGRWGRFPEVVKNWEAKAGEGSSIALQNHGDSVVMFRNVKVRPAQ
jgi:hypothetical protein